jgi:oligopeptide/dipeptide ABC transporter ATP-binding protein
LIEPDSGSIIFQGVELTQLSQRQMRPIRKDIQIIFQDPYSSLNPRITVFETLVEPLRIHKLVSRDQEKQRVAELLELVGLPPEAMTRYPHEFSGGQRQRVGIARALAVNPKLIVADEAVSALDISIQAQIINLLMDLKEKLGLTLVFIAHDLKVVEHISDRVCVMYLGKIMEILPAKKIGEARHPYTKCLLSAIPVADPTIKVERQILKGEPPSPIDLPSGCVFHTRCPKAVATCASQVPQLQWVGDQHLLACDVM